MSQNRKSLTPLKGQRSISAFFTKKTTKTSDTAKKINNENAENVTPERDVADKLTPSISQKMSQKLKISQPDTPKLPSKNKKRSRSPGKGKPPKIFQKYDDQKEEEQESESEEIKKPRAKRLKRAKFEPDSSAEEDEDESESDFEADSMEDSLDDFIDDDDFEDCSMDESGSEEEEDSENDSPSPKKPKTKKIQKSEKSSNKSSKIEISKKTVNLDLSRFSSTSPRPDQKNDNKKQTPNRNLSGSKKSKNETENLYFHETLPFLQPDKIRDKDGRKPSDPAYDGSTLYIPKTWYDTKVTKTTPMTFQFFKMKETNFDTIFMFKVGKFYEFYHMDAEVAVRCLGLNKQNSVNLKAGFPEMAYDRYQRDLVDQGYKVARCEQTETDEAFKKRKAQIKSRRKLEPWEDCIKREICSIATSGTIGTANAFEIEAITSTDTSTRILGGDKNFANQYFFSIYQDAVNDPSGNRLALCYIHAGRGEWGYKFIKNDDRYHSNMLGLLSYYQISQMLVPNNLSTNLIEKLESRAIFLEYRANSKFWEKNKIIKCIKKCQSEEGYWSFGDF